jgi:flagellar basal body-associated protein FliL
MSTSVKVQTSTTSQQPAPNNNKKRLIFILLGLAGIALTGGIIFAVIRGAGEEKDVAPTDPNTVPTAPPPVTEHLKEEEDEEGERGEKDQPPSAPPTSTPVHKDEASEVKVAETGLLGKAVAYIKSQSLMVQIAMGVGVVLFLAALGLTIWQVVEISLGNESILELVPGRSEAEPTVPKTDETKPDTQTEAANERLALRNSRLKATSVATAGALCLGISVILVGFALLAIAAEVLTPRSNVLKTIKESATLWIPGVILLLAGVVGIVLAEILGNQLFGALPNHFAYLAVGAGLAMGVLILAGMSDFDDTKPRAAGKTNTPMPIFVHFNFMKPSCS